MKATSDSTIAGLRHIIAATDLSPAGHAAWDAAMQLASLSPGCQVTTVLVVEPMIAMGMPDLVVMDHGLPGRLKSAEESLAKARTDSPTRAASALKVEAGIAPEVIIDAAEKLQADLIVVASHGLRGIKRFMLGSTAERVIHDARCAVLVLKPDDAADRAKTSLRFDRILAAYDGSPGSLSALGQAVDLAVAHGGRVLLAEAVEPYPEQYPHRAWPAVVENHLAEAPHLLETVKARQSRPDCIDILVDAGKPWKFLCETAERQGVSLIILGPHGHRRLGDFFLGSTAERVVRRAHCPVLITARPKSDS